MPTKVDFAGYYLNTTLSDVRVVIRASDEVEELPGHGIVLSLASRHFKRQIEQQQQQHLGALSGATVTLDVGAGQLAAAKALLRWCYDGALPAGPQPEQQALLVHMLHVSHCFGVAECAAACVGALLALPSLALDTVHLVLSLLPDAGSGGGGSSGTAAELAPLVQHCLSHLQQQLGDLEATLRSPTLRASLDRLPHSALLGLLRGEARAAALVVHLHVLALLAQPHY